MANYIAIITAILHFVQALLVFILIFASPSLHGGSANFPTYLTLKEYHNTSGFSFEVQPTQSFNVPAAICAFFLLSAVAQTVQIVWMDEDYVDQIRLRYMEYSISASIMLVCIAIEVGISDIVSLVSLAILMFETNVLGLLADILTETTQNTWALLAHLAAWISCCAPYTMILVQFFYNVQNSQRRPPDFVYAIVFVMALLFCSFGFVQSCDLLFQPEDEQRKHDFKRNIAYAYDVLSLTAKTLLAWLILGPILNNAFN